MVCDYHLRIESLRKIQFFHQYVMSYLFSYFWYLSLAEQYYLTLMKFWRNPISDSDGTQLMHYWGGIYITEPDMISAISRITEFYFNRLGSFKTVFLKWFESTPWNLLHLLYKNSFFSVKVERTIKRKKNQLWNWEIIGRWMKKFIEQKSSQQK